MEAQKDWSVVLPCKTSVEERRLKKPPGLGELAVMYHKPAQSAIAYSCLPLSLRGVVK
jgi:hypothetical protein